MILGVLLLFVLGLAVAVCVQVVFGYFLSFYLIPYFAECRGWKDFLLGCSRRQKHVRACLLSVAPVGAMTFGGVSVLANGSFAAEDMVGRWELVAGAEVKAAAPRGYFQLKDTGRVAFSGTLGGFAGTRPYQGDGIWEMNPEGDRLWLKFLEGGPVSSFAVSKHKGELVCEQSVGDPDEGREPLVYQKVRQIASDR